METIEEQTKFVMTNSATIINSFKKSNAEVVIITPTEDEGDSYIIPIRQSELTELIKCLCGDYFKMVVKRIKIHIEKRKGFVPVVFIGNGSESYFTLKPDLDYFNEKALAVK